MIHGDLKGVCDRSNSSFTTALTRVQPNILMDGSGNARIVDFGFTTVTQNLDSVRSIQCQRGFTPRWTAPEILDEAPHSKEGDIFSFAMVMIEVRGRLLATQDFGPSSFRINTGIRCCGPVRWSFNHHGYAGHNTRQAPATTDTPNFHRKFMEIDATLLES